MNVTMAKPILTPDQAALLIRDGVTVAIGGSGAGHSIPERMLEAIGRRHHSSGAPRELTLIHPFGVGDQGARGLEHMAMPGLYRRVIGGHWSMSPSMAKLAAENLFEAYCLPAGIVVQLFHAAASGSPGFISQIGLHTFIDPRVEGGKLNARTVEDRKEYLYYRAHPIDVALIRGAVADEEGNLSMHEEVAPWHNCAMAQAARAAGGITIAQVKRIVPARSLDPLLVHVPGIFIDYLIVDPDQGMTYNIGYDPALSGEARKPESEFAAFPFSVRKSIARRAAMELRPGAVINVGFGVPDGVMKVAREQGIAQSVVPTIEQGQIGGIPAEGLEFGAAYNSTAIIGTLAVRGGKPKFVPAVRQITFSGANAIATGQEVLYVTEAAVFRLTAEGLQLEEVAPGLDAERDVIARMAFQPLMGASLGTMRAELFAPALLPADCFPAFQ